MGESGIHGPGAPARRVFRRLLLPRRTWGILAAAALVATGIAIPAASFADSTSGCDFFSGTTNLCSGPLTGSTFAGGDGNLQASPSTYGTTDWSNVTGLNVGIDQPSGSGDNAFGQGTKEDNPKVTVVDGSIPPNKSDLTRFYESSEFANGSNFLYLAWERSNVLGNANMDFEINQQATSGFTGTTTGSVTLNRQPGDMLITYDFTNGGGKPVLGLDRWLKTATNPVVPGFATNVCLSSSSFPCWGDHKDLNGTNSIGAVNTDTVSDPIDPNSGNYQANLPALTFGEAAINLTAAGVFPTGTCEAFGSAFLKSRASSSFTSEVKDFVAPVQVNISNCGTITVTKQTENGNNTFDYSTTGGLSPSTFTLMGGETQTYGPGTVLPGNYTVTEGTPPSGWSLKSLNCTTNGTSGTSQSTSGATASITIAPQGEVDCLYINHTNLSPTIATSLSETTGNIGDKVTDSATLTGATANAGGTVTYTVYSDNTCTNAVADGGTVPVTNGVVPDSNAVTFNNAGTYYWQAAYSGDANNSGATSDCTSEKLIIKTGPSISTQLSETSGNIGDKVTDSATLTNATANAGGTVTYTVYSDNTCTNAVADGGTVPVTNGVVPDSSAVTFNNAGTYYWQAAYSGDANNNPATSSCTSEKLIIKTGPSITTQLSASTVNIGDSVIDSATLSNVTADAGGTVTYTVYSDNTCTNAVADGGTVPVTGGGVPQSSPVVFNNAGTYYWQAAYSGDANNNPATSSCTSEELLVKTNPSITTQLSASTVNIGTPVTDSAMLSNATADAGGTVTYSVYSDSSCQIKVADGGTVPVAGGMVPGSNPVTFNNAGTYYWQAVYSGDTNNNGATSDCLSEQLVVNPNTPGISTAQHLIPNDDATISGATQNAGGAITFNLYSPGDANCSGVPAYTQQVGVSGDGTYKTTNTGFVASDPGEWRWQVIYSGDPNNVGTVSACGVENFTINNG